MTASPVAPVEIAGAAGVVLHGQRWAGSGAWVVLLHDRGDDVDLDCWQPLAPHLAARDWTVLAVDLRGHGASGGTWDPDLVAEDVAAVVAFARSEGARFLAIVAAGASAPIVLSGAAATRPDALVLLSPTIGPDDEMASMRGAGEPKLFLVGSGDDVARDAAERMRHAAIGWGVLIRLPTVEQGAALLGGGVAAQAREHIIGFLAEQRFLAGRRSGSPRDAVRSQSGARTAAGTDAEQRSDHE